MSACAAGRRRSGKKILLVCSGGCAGLEERLAAAGCLVINGGEGSAAVNRARREIFETAVIVSTGSEMDLAETVFNLRDVSYPLEIVIVADAVDSGRDLIERIAAVVPNTVILDSDKLPARLKRSPIP